MCIESGQAFDRKPGLAEMGKLVCIKAPGGRVFVVVNAENVPLYSVVINSASAMVSIIGGLHVGRLAERLARLQELRKEAEAQVAATGKQYSDRMLLWRELRQHWMQELQADDRAIASGAAEREVTEMRDWDGRTKTGPTRIECGPHRDHISALLGQLSLVEPVYKPLPVNVTAEHARAFALEGRSVRYEAVGRSKEMLLEDVAAMEDVAVRMDKLAAGAGAPSEVVLLLLLGLLSAAGIGFPLALLFLQGGLTPLPADIALASVFGFVVMALNLYFWDQSRRGKLLTRLTWPSAESETASRRRWSFR
jgi:hypothetical protein